MHQKIKNIQKRYEGFLQTNYLWENTNIYDLQQFIIDVDCKKILIDISEKLRLGNYIERFVSFQLLQNPIIEIIAENIQIQQDKLTLGELDCILLKDKKPIHLEIVYKFYLYDTNIGATEIEHCIGPNKKDTLLQKLTKLVNKQLPLLYSKECDAFLKTIHLTGKNIQQNVYFKAQLFVPYCQKNIKLKLLNTNCIAGFYINKTALHQFDDCTFFIPVKKDWLIVPHKNVDWLDFKEFKTNSEPYLERQFSPLCWLKKPNGVIKKFFLIWW